jgi:PAS domain S-box-containing protein
MPEIGAPILDELPVGVWVGRVPDGASVYANRAFRDILGTDAVQESRIGDVPRTYRVFTRAGQPFPVEQLPFSRVVATGEAVVVDGMVIHRADGGRIDLRAFGQPVLDAAGTLTQVIVAFVDITREVQAEVQRQRTASHLQFALEHAPVAIFSIDCDGIITLSEGAGLKSLGVKSGQLVGQSVFDLYKDHPTIPGYIRRGLAGDSFWYTVQVGDAVYDSWLAPLRDDAGTIVGVMGLSNDVSELRQLQARVIEADRVRAMGMLAASVAHEINNPLSYVLSCLRRVETHVQAADPSVHEDLSTAIGGVDRIAAITRDLRTFSRPANTAVGPVDVEAAIHSVLRLVRKEIEARARLRLFLAADRPVLGNEARLSQVLTNLVMNAVQSLPAGRPETDEVEISAHVAGDQVVIEVGDSGPGVPVKERERIFEPFVTTKPIGGGTGLGLFVCRNIVRWMGGEITVGDRTGGGALFRVVLPAAPERAAAAAPAPARPAPNGELAGLRVLVIDDDEIVADMIVAQLAAAGVHAAAEHDPDRALQRLLAEEETFDLVFCDLMMRGRTGMDIAAAVKAARPERLRRIVFMTGGAFTPKAAAFVSAHSAACVDKPFDVTEETRKRLSPR